MKNEIEVNSIGEIMDAIREIDNGQTMWYRGHGDKHWATVPSVQRYEDYSDGLERELVNTFRIRAAQILEDAPAKNDYSGWMSLMQHYGLATRLMDWSKSPLIAAYFATEDNKKTRNKDACMWILWPSVLNQDQIHSQYVFPMDSITVEEMLSKAFRAPRKRQQGYLQQPPLSREMDSIQRYGREYNTGEHQPRGYEHIVACEPVEHNLRMYSQQACFTVHDTYENSAGKNVPTLEDIAKRIARRNTGERLTTKLIIPCNAKRSISKELARLGITKSFIYPDMDHLSEEIKERLLKK